MWLAVLCPFTLALQNIIWLLTRWMEDYSLRLILQLSCKMFFLPEHVFYNCFESDSSLLNNRIWTVMKTYVLFDFTEIVHKKYKKNPILRQLSLKPFDKYTMPSCFYTKWNLNFKAKLTLQKRHQFWKPLEKNQL